jgi:hypothetical protein
MMKTRGLHLISICGFLLLTSCNYFLDWKKGDLLSGQASTPTISEKATVDSEMIQNTVLKSCTKCHSGQKSPKLTTIEEIKNNIDDVVDAVESDKMPPKSSGLPHLSACDKEILRSWVAAGMPNASSQKAVELGACQGDGSQTQTPPSQPPTPPPTVPPSPPPTPPANPPGDTQPTPPSNPPVEPPPGDSQPNPPNNPPTVPPNPPVPPDQQSILDMPLNYETLRVKILEPRCLHCHKEGATDPNASETFLFPYSELASHPKLLGTGSADSRLFKMVSRTDDRRMPPPEESGPLSADEIEFIKRWVDAGHPEK